jgi:hypothetical protein
MSLSAKNTLGLVVSVLVFAGLACGGGTALTPTRSKPATATEVTSTMLPPSAAPGLLTRIAGETATPLGATAAPTTMPSPASTKAPKPTARPKPTNTFTPAPTETRPPTVEPKPTDTFTPEPSAKPVIDAWKVVGIARATVEQWAGKPIETFPVGNSQPPMADVVGGTSCTYRLNGYDFYVDYDKAGTAQLFQVVDGLSAQGFKLKDWPKVLSMFGIEMPSAPDVSAPAAVRWNNYKGYEVSVIMDGIRDYSVVWTVQVYKPYK